MEPPSDYKSALEKTASLNEELILLYRESTRSVRDPAVGRFLHSVLDQKTSQSELLRAVAASGEADRNDAPVPEEAAPDPDPGASSGPAEAALRRLEAEESRLADRFDRLREASLDEENRRILRSLCETSRKLSVWARDHRELLRLF